MKTSAEHVLSNRCQNWLTASSMKTQINPAVLACKKEIKCDPVL